MNDNKASKCRPGHAMPGFDALYRELAKLSPDTTHGVAIVHRGHLIVEQYGCGHGPGTPHNIFSCTKSVVSALVGIALDQGRLRGLEQELTELLPEFDRCDTARTKKNLNLRHLLTMTSGLDWSEWPPSPSGRSTVYQMQHSDNWVAFVLERPLAAPPGRVFNYCSGASHLLAAVIEQVTGQDLECYARRYLFAPLGIETVFWQSDPQGVRFGGSGLHMTVRDLARFGCLYLNKGCWNGRQLIPGDWTTASTRPQSDGYPGIGSYGYQWWLRLAGSTTVFSAIGMGGQALYVAPALDLAAAFTGWNPRDPDQAWRVMQGVIAVLENK